jgi:ring-1,2-phenylacetyl-CoA epoxidase subunit PaaC
VDYHEQRSRNWVIRLGDGTQQSHEYMQSAINDLWSYTDELFVQGDDELQLVAQGIAANQANIEDQWRATVGQTLTEATLTQPTDCFQKFGGKQGEHSEPFGLMLAEMQSLYRAHPGAVW